MKKSRPFAFKIVAAEFFAAVHKIPLKNRGTFITQFVTDLVTLEPITEYGTQVVGETIDFIKKQSEFGKSGGKPKHRHPRGTLEAPFTEPIGTPYPEEELEVKEEIKDLTSTSKLSLFEIRLLHQESFGTNMPGGCNTLAHELCQKHTADSIRNAFEIASIQGKQSMAYVNGVLNGTGEKPQKETRMKTFADAARERDLEETRAFVEEMRNAR